MKTITTFDLVKLAFGALLASALVYAFIVGDFSHFGYTYLG